MAAYYNDVEPYVCQWLRNLIAAGHIAPGDVDERSIADVHPDDLRGYTQCHFFAGIGGWSYALRLAGWPDDRPVWTGSCPCQPFSAAGAQRGSDDERHLWPAFFRLIRECRPATVLGEQVAGAAGLAWLDHVCADLESAGYAAAAADMPAACVGAPHIRQRLWWVAHSCREGLSPCKQTQFQEAQQFQEGRPTVQRSRASAPGGMDSVSMLRQFPMHDPPRARPRLQLPRTGSLGRERHESIRSGNWMDRDELFCQDGKYRPTQPGLLPLAHGVPGRVGRLRAYGNAIVPQVAAAFIESVMECIP